MSLSDRVSMQIGIMSKQDNLGSTSEKRTHRETGNLPSKEEELGKGPSAGLRGPLSLREENHAVEFLERSSSGLGEAGEILLSIPSQGGFSKEKTCSSRH